MDTITIPKRLTGGKELVVIPRKEYEEFLRSKKQNLAPRIVVRRSPSFRIPKKYEKFYLRLDKRLTKALEEYRAGKYAGPFGTVEEGIASLKSRKSINAKK